MDEEALTSGVARRVAKIRLNPMEIARMLELPDGFEVIAVQGRWDPVSIEVIVKADSLPESPIDAEAPFAQGWVTVEDGGVRRLEWKWPTEHNVWVIL